MSSTSRGGKRGYRYGERWLYRSIPSVLVEEIKGWGKAVQS